MLAGAVVGATPCMGAMLGLSLGGPLVAVPIVLFIAGGILMLNGRTRAIGGGLAIGSGLGLALMVIFAFVRWFIDPTVSF